MGSLKKTFAGSERSRAAGRFCPELEALEDRFLPAGIKFVGLLPSTFMVGSTFSIRVSKTPVNPSQGPVVLSVVDPLNLSHLIGQTQGTPDANGNVLFLNLAIDYAGPDLAIQATIANTTVSVTSSSFLVVAHATRTRDQFNFFEGKYETLEGGLPYPLNVEWMARHIAQKYDGSVFTHLFDNDGTGLYGTSLDRAYPHLTEVMQLIKKLHPGFEIMGYVPAFTDVPWFQGTGPGGWDAPDGGYTGFQNWANQWASLQTDTGAPLVDTLFLDYMSPWIESEAMRDDIYSYAKDLGMHIIANAPIYTNNFRFAIDSPYMTAGDGVLIEGAMGFNGQSHDSFGNWIPACTINSELIWARNYKPLGLRLLFLTTAQSGVPINPDSKAGRLGEIYAHRYGASGFTYTNSSLNNVANTLDPVPNSYFLNPILNPLNSLQAMSLSSVGANQAGLSVPKSANLSLAASSAPAISQSSSPGLAGSNLSTSVQKHATVLIQPTTAKASPGFKAFAPAGIIQNVTEESDFQ